MSDLYPRLQLSAPLREQVYAALEVLILDGRLQPGKRLVETELASQLGVSRGPIREALQLLARDGWLDMHPHHGTYVRQIKWEELEDYFWVRELLEVEAARLAARRVHEGSNDIEAEIEQLRGLVSHSSDLSAKLADAPHAESPELAETRRQFRSTSREFHYTVARLSGKAALTELLEYLGKRTRWYFSRTYLGMRETRRQEHTSLIDAIESGDEKGAAEAMRRHIDDLREWSREAFEDDVS